MTLTVAPPGRFTEVETRWTLYLLQTPTVSPSVFRFPGRQDTLD